MTISAAPGPRAPVSILAVDDDPTSRMLARATLEPHLGTVVEAENGLLAVEALESRAFDLAIVDLDMPVMDGFGVIERARAREETRHLPIIVVTGRDDVVAIERAFALGATSFLCKPINWNLFRHQVGYVMKVARVEKDIRAAKERAERIAEMRARALTAMVGEAERAIAGSLAGERLEAVVARVRHAIEILTGEAVVAREAVRAGDLAKAAVERVREARGDSEAERVEIRGDGTHGLFCDRALVAEALYEILANALAFSPPGEAVSLTLSAAAPGRVRFEIADRGPGIPEHRLEAGFEPFGSERHAEGSQSGLGVGLAVARAIVKAHEGHIGIMSEPGRGTEVFVTLPALAGRAQGEGAVNPGARIFPTDLAKAEDAFAS